MLKRLINWNSQPRSRWLRADLSKRTAANDNRITHPRFPSATRRPRRERIRFRLSRYVLLSRGNLPEFPKDAGHAPGIELIHVSQPRLVIRVRVAA